MSESAKNNSDMKRFYDHLWTSIDGDSKTQFMRQLKTNLTLGPIRTDHVLLQLDMLQETHREDLLHALKDENLLHVWASFHRDEEVMKLLIDICPHQLEGEREGHLLGENVLHVLVRKQSLTGVQHLLDLCQEKDWQNYLNRLLNGKAVGQHFAGTIMLGELPLSVAALTFNKHMVLLLMRYGAKLHEVNTQGDTVLHSLIRFASLYTDKEEAVVHMLSEINGYLQRNPNGIYQEAEPSSVWFLQNKEGLTALKLAAKFALPKVFNFILHLPGIYCRLDHQDGLLDVLMYDITEIDPLAQQKWQADQFSRPQRRQKMVFLDEEGRPASQYKVLNEGGNRSGQSASQPAPSVLEILCQSERMDNVLDILKTYVIRNIVEAKWNRYKWGFLAWFLFHVLFMSLLSMHAIFKADLIQLKADPSTSNGPSTFPGTAKELEASVLGWAMVFFVVSFFQVFLEVTRWPCWRCVHCFSKTMSCAMPEIFFSLHSIEINGAFRLQLFFINVSVMIDCIWYWVSGPVNNYFLTLALVLGWWFLVLFLRPLRKFSYFTVMLQKAVLGDLMRFAVMVVLQWLAFSIAMYITFLVTPGHSAEEFETVGKTMATMFKLIFGAEDVNLYSAADPWLSHVLYVLYIIMAHLLMLNALIAMMANTCSFVAGNKDGQWELQRLSVVLLLEDVFWYLPACRLFKNQDCIKQKVARYDLAQKRLIYEDRYFVKVTSVDTRDGSTWSHKESVVDLRVSMMLQMMKTDEHLFPPMSTPSGTKRKRPAQEGNVQTYASLRKAVLKLTKKENKEIKKMISTLTDLAPVSTPGSLKSAASASGNNVDQPGGTPNLPGATDQSVIPPPTVSQPRCLQRSSKRRKRTKSSRVLDTPDVFTIPLARHDDQSEA